MIENDIQDKERLIELISFIRQKELDKPFDEIDSDLITLCTELLLDLQNKNVTLTPEEIEERVKNIPFVETTEAKTVKTKPRTTKKRVLLIAAIITILGVIFSLSSTATQWNYYDLLLIEKFGRVSNAPEGVTFYKGDTSYGANGPGRSYESFEDWAKNEDTDILLPKSFPDCFTFYGILVGPDGDYEETIFSFNNGMTSYTVTHDAPIPQGVLDNVKPVTIGNTTVYIEDLHNVKHYQVHFSYKGDYYCIIHREKEPVQEILKELEPYL